jgi:hypothetical protein
MAKFNDKSGRRFGRLLVINLHSKPKGRATWNCQCDCGTVKTIKSSELTAGKTKSCGCFRREVVSKRRKTHGNAANPTYTTWVRIWQRCTNPKNARWSSYGGRGIAVCERWALFENFLADMGQKPNGLSIDRYPNNDGNYEPGNCRWATNDEQMNNTSRSLGSISAFGKTMTPLQWSKELGIPYITIINRLHNGLPADKILGPSPYRLKNQPNSIPTFHRRGTPRNPSKKFMPYSSGS